MRNSPDSCLIYGGETTWENVPCYFAFLDAVKSDLLYGGGTQVSSGSILIPLYVDVPELGKSLEDYRVILVSPHHPRIDQPMVIDSVRWVRIHQVLQVTIPNVA